VKILFDQGTPVPQRRLHPAHTVDTCAESGWSQLQNGKLLREAGAGGYEVSITTDQNIRYQQNVTGWRMAILVLLSTSWPRIRLRAVEISTAVVSASPGDYLEIPV
jgi:hypothetical protein